MANITISIPDAVMPRVVDAFTKQYMYQDQVPDPQNPGQTIPNPETKNQFVQRQVRDYIKNTLASQEGMVAQTTAHDKVRGDFG